MSSSVRFVDTHTKSSRNSANAGTQTFQINFVSIGTDSLIAPEKGTQTDQHYWNRSTIAHSLKINQNLVDTILRELENARREGPLFTAYEQRCGEIAREVSIRQVKNLELPKINGTSTIITAIRCGPASRMAILLGDSQHDSWCTDHQGQLILVHRRQTQTIPLPVCPSEALFARHGELLIVGLQSGEILLISAKGNTGEILWSSGTTLHNRAVTKLQWASAGAAERQVLSIGLDGKVLKSRLESDNRLEVLQSVQITLNDIPKSMRKGTTGTAKSIGLVDMVLADQRNIFVATETGALLAIDLEHLSVKESFELTNSNGIEQIALSNEDENGNRCLIWRTSDCRMYRGFYQSGGTTLTDVQLLPIGRTKLCEFCLISNNTNADLPQLLFIISEMGDGNKERRRELLGWNLFSSELVFRDAQNGEQLDAITFDQSTGDLMIGITKGTQHQPRQLITYEIIMG